MTIRNLDALFKPAAVALIGATDTPGSVGSAIVNNLFGSEFGGDIMLVNPNHRSIAGISSYPDIDSLPKTPDLGIVCTPPNTVPRIITELGDRGARGAVVISAGFGEGGTEKGKALRKAVLEAAKPHLMRIVGPNCLGILAPGSNLNASFSATVPTQGKLAFVTQSGAIATAVVDWATSRGIGFSHLVSLGDMIDVDFADMLDYLANDPGTTAILLYIEAITSARKFMSAARAAARMKPVIVVKAGRHAEGAQAAASHTGALAGEDRVYEAAFRRAGILRVLTLEELFDAVEILAVARRPKGDRMALLSNGGGIAVLATDSLIDEGGRLMELSPELIGRLNNVLPATWSHANPIDIIGDAQGDRYSAALEALFDSRSIDAVLVLNCPTGVASQAEAAEAVIETVKDWRDPFVLTSWVGGQTARQARRLFSDKGIPTYDTPEQATHAFMYMIKYQRSQNMLMETPPSVPEDFSMNTALVRKLIEGALAENRTWLNEFEAKTALAAYGIPVVSTEIAKTPKEAALLAAGIGGPVALKILSPDITHKSEVGGVALDLAGPQAVQTAADIMKANVLKVSPKARIDGFTVQPMVRRPGAFELIVGMKEDRQFGPVILFGQGGTAVEVIRDRAVGLPPLNMHLARDLMSQTRVFHLLEGYRNHAPANLDAIAITLIKIAQFVTDHAEVIELDINPLLADAYGVIALDARIKVAEQEQSAVARLAIRPYPKELEERIPIGKHRELLLRPVVPEDEPSLHRGFAKLTPEEIRLRFFVPMSTMSHVTAARFTQIDYDREMALILTDPGVPGEGDIYGVVRISADPDNESAEYAIVVRHDMTGLGLGVFLMRRIIDYTTKRGIGNIFGHVLRENTTMRKLCKALGFTESREPEDPGVVRVSLDLRP